MSIAGPRPAGHIIPVMATAPTSPGPRFDSLQQEVYLGLWRTYDRLRALEDELFATYELTAQQYNVLRLLKAARPESVPTLALADRLVSRAPDITRMIDRLEERGLVARERQAEDRRVVRLRITDADLKKLSALLRAARLPHEPETSVWR
jgi:DNA-binding MarR family transcriptional regulator